jgi:mono/diheme cytochrome c family protein
MSCGGDEKKDKKQEKIGSDKTEITNKSTSASNEIPVSERITLDNKGVGKIKNVKLSSTINQSMVVRGAELYENHCMACHQIGRRFIGPSPNGIMKRRSPEWIMNMILNPKLMTEQDQIAKELFLEFDSAAMSNQNMTEAQARDILEYLRTLD